MEKFERNDEWVEFGQKIIYIYEKIFNTDEEQLLHYFTDINMLHKKQSRKKTIKNWLNGNTKKPNGFHLSKFKISDFKLNNELLFPLNAFKFWSLEKFQQRGNLYLQEKMAPHVSQQIRYIYFLNIDEQNLGYFEIGYPNPNNNLAVELTSALYTIDMTYKGHITNYNNISYLSVQNQFDYMNFTFKNSVNVYKKEIKIFGVAQCIDAARGEPKAYMTLLTSDKLSLEEEKKYAHKLNYSNLIIADDFSHNCLQEKDFFLENFTQRIDALGRDISYYDIDKAFSNNMYFDIVLNEYKSYVQLLEKSIYHSSYFINNRRESILLSFKEMCKDKHIEATIAYLLGSESISILDDKNPILETQLQLVAEGRLSLTYLFVIEDCTILDDEMIERIQYIQKNGIKIKISTESRTIYSKILWVKEQHFAMFKMQNQSNDNVDVTQDPLLIEKLSFEIKFLERLSISMEAFLTQYYALNGIWYSYSYNSKNDNNTFQAVKFKIQNNSFTAYFPSHHSQGLISKNDEYTLLLFKHSIIKIQNINLKDKIFRISIIGKEKEMYNRDVLLFGLMSKEALSDEQVHMLLSNLHHKEENHFRLKISNEFDSTLAMFSNEHLI